MSDCIVLGAGMVGVSTALALQARGKQVVLIDRRNPGQETSYGNAGIIQSEAVEPYAFPRDLASIVSIALKRGNDVNWNLAAMPLWARPVWHYFRHSAAKRYKTISSTYSQLISRAIGDHAPWIEASGSGNLIAKNGFRQVFRSPRRFEQGLRTAERLHAEFGVGMRIEDASALRAAEPHLKRDLQGAVHWTQPWTCASPGTLTANYARLFEAQGGGWRSGDAETLRESGSGWTIETADGPLEAPDVVIALGPWTPKLLQRFGYDVPMLFERGYHRHFTGGTQPTVPIMDVENAAIIAPMLDGSRILTGAELTRFDAMPALRQLKRAEQGISELFDLGTPVEGEPWMGNRPCMPDMLPVVGPAPRHKGLWLNFGHGHQGFTLGPTTAALLADAMTGATPDLVDRLGLAR
ncbi:NAD(P)/FAD-dependent oxidoreductase [Tianweitania sediminis]|uniref:FAD-binding oxidoreductase n=1 Tax=Tianweitania sediminis TaxID=1502156 RepID=A0A8J7RNB3_9HYPH|nr:FAD-dependent oxidoreductase [Tianweitania sediminis]MBP0438924.1 FAD-binding oxidoreductase [Tianweitania sediminis]